MPMEISNTYKNYASTYTNGTDGKKQTSETKTTTKTDNANITSAAKTNTSDYLAELQKKYPKLNILTGYSNGSAGSSNYPEKINVTINPGFLAKMESDPELAAKYEKNLADIPAACKWGESMIRAMTGDTVYEFRFYIDENGNMSAGSVSGPSEKREAFERTRQHAKQQKEEYNKRLEEHIKASAEKKEKVEKQIAEKRAENKEQKEQLAEQTSKRKEEKDNLHSHKITVDGSDIWSATEKMVEAISHTAVSKNAMSETAGIDIKV